MKSFLGLSLSLLLVWGIYAIVKGLFANLAL